LSIDIYQSVHVVASRANAYNNSVALRGDCPQGRESPAPYGTARDQRAL
jgi:hypothetical protein